MAIERELAVKQARASEVLVSNDVPRSTANRVLLSCPVRIELSCRRIYIPLDWLITSYPTLKETWERLAVAIRKDSDGLLARTSQLIHDAKK